MSITIPVISNITDYCVSVTQCYYLEYFMPMSHGVNKKAPTFVSLIPPLTGSHKASCFASNTLSSFFCSDRTDYCKNNAFSK